MARITGGRMLSKADYTRMGREDAKSGHKAFKFSANVSPDFINSYNVAFNKAAERKAINKENIKMELAAMYAA